MAEAEGLYRATLAAWEKNLGPEDPNVAACLSDLGRLQDNRGKYLEAEQLHRRALAIWETALGADSVEVGTALNNLAAVNSISWIRPLFQA